MFKVINEGNMNYIAHISEDGKRIQTVKEHSENVAKYSCDEAKNIGVDSFWYKETNKENILDIMTKTMEGKHIYPADTFTVAFGNITNHDLTNRELQILKEMLAGDSNAEIAKRLYISPGTVKRHIENMLTKTGFHTRTELAAEACRLGIVIKDKKDNNVTK